eukprot:3721387-Prymnesium_polylepis.2
MHRPIRYCAPTTGSNQRTPPSALQACPRWQPLPPECSETASTPDLGALPTCGRPNARNQICQT